MPFPGQNDAFLDPVTGLRFGNIIALVVDIAVDGDSFAAPPFFFYPEALPMMFPKLLFHR